MAHFYGTLKGNRGMTSRLGTKASGMEANIKGWSVGVRVYISHERGKDVIRVYSTGKQGTYTDMKLIAKIIEGEE